jgi:GNAT superfamily N-acetyltransferase
MEFLIRAGKVEDSKSIAELSHQLGYPASNEETIARLQPIISNSDNCVYVACHQNVVVGWVHAFYSLRVESASFVEIGGLVVDAGFRNKGLGRLLVNQVLEWAKLKGIERIRVRSNVVRTETHRFYQILGFKEIKEQKVFALDLR